MLDKVKGSIVHKSRKITELLPLHKLLITTFSKVEEVLIEQLSENQDINKSRLEIKNLVDDLLKITSRSKNAGDPTIQKYLNQTTNIIRGISSINELFYEELPDDWEEYLLTSLESILVNMKNRGYLLETFKIAIKSIQANEKVKFLSIIDTLTDNKSASYEINKILDELRSQFGIDFIKVGGTGCVLKITKKTYQEGKITNNIKGENLETVCKIIDYSKDPSGEILNQILDVFKKYIEEIFSKKSSCKFTQDEFVQFAQNKLPFFTLSTIRNFTKELYKKFHGQGLVMEKISGSNVSQMYFDEKIYSIFMNTYFPDPISNPDLEIRLREFLSGTIYHHSTECELFINSIISHSQDKRFFVIKKFLEDNNINPTQKRKMNEILSILCKNNIVGKYGKEKYYLINYVPLQDTISLEEEVQMLRAELLNLKDIHIQNKRLQEKNRLLRLENELLKKDNAENGPTIEELKRELEEKTQALKIITLELGELRESINDGEKQLERKDGSITYYRNLSENREKALKKAREKISQQEIKIAELEKILNSSILKKENNQLKDELAEVKKQLDILKKSQTEYQRKISLLEHNIVLEKTTLTPSVGTTSQNQKKKIVKRKSNKEITQLREQRNKEREEEIHTIDHECVLKGFTIHGIFTPKYYNILKKLFETLTDLSKTTIEKNEVIKIQTGAEKIEIILDKKYQKYQSQVEFVAQEIEERNNLLIYISFV